MPCVPRASFQVACLLQDLEYTDTITKTWTLMTWFSLFGWELRNHHSLPPLSFCDGTFGWWSVSHSVALGSARSFVKLITPDELSNARTLSVCGLSEVSFTLQKISSIKRCYCVLPRNLAILRNILLSTREEMEFNPQKTNTVPKDNVLWCSCICSPFEINIVNSLSLNNNVTNARIYLFFILVTL